MEEDCQRCSVRQVSAFIHNKRICNKISALFTQLCSQTSGYLTNPISDHIFAQAYICQHLLFVWMFVRVKLHCDHSRHNRDDSYVPYADIKLNLRRLTLGQTQFLLTLTFLSGTYRFTCHILPCHVMFFLRTEKVMLSLM